MFLLDNDNFSNYLPASFSIFNQEPSLCQINDCLEDIDENDLLNFSNNDIDSTVNHFIIDTPPETPVNQQSYIGNVNKDYLSPNTPFDNLLDLNGNYNEIVESPKSQEIPNLTKFSPPSIPIENNCPTIATTTVGYLSNTIPVNCLTQPNRTNPTLNVFNLDRTTLLNCKISDSHNVPKIHIQPKIILPDKISNNLKSIDNTELIKKQKIEARKVRNREAALNSRLKKQEYLNNLESQVKKLSKENNDLLLENALLKQKINDLEQELVKFKNLDLNSESSKKAKISFFAVAFVIFFQLSPYFMSISPGINNSINNKNSLVKTNEKHLSRTLLWNRNELSSNEYFQFNNNNPISFNSSNFNRTNCNEYYNRTESIRLDSELRGFLSHFKLEENNSKRRLHQQKKSKTNAKKLLYDLNHVPIPRLKFWIQKQRYIDHINDELAQNLEQFFPFDYENLMSMIHRRDDTFYYLSYPSKGHLILPSMSNRTDIRPRFSFLIPTFYNFNNLNNSVANSSNPNGTALSVPQLFMMQIDCQVINTKVTLVNMDGGEFRNKTNVSQFKRLRPVKHRNNK